MSPETRKLIEEIKEYYKVSDLSELNDEQWKEISGYEFENSLTEEFIEKYKNNVNWYHISGYQKLSENFINKYADKLDWYLISSNQKLSEPFIEKHADKIHWKNISAFQTLSEEFIEKYSNKVDWESISAYNNFSLNFIKKHTDKINYQRLFYNEYLNIKEKMKNFQKYPEWTEVILKIYKNDLYNDFPVSDIKRKFQTRKFWKNYIEYLKNGYPDKNIFQVKLLNTLMNISNTFNVDKNRLIGVIDKIFKKNIKNKNKKINIG